MNGYRLFINKESSSNKNFKPDTNKLSTNKRCQFLENIVIRSEVSEQNLNGYCKVDFVFSLESNKCLVYLWHYDTTCLRIYF